MFSYVNGRIKTFISVPEKKRLLENFFSLTVLQGLNYVLPLVTVPYLVRVLGPEKLGLIAFANATVAYFGVLIDYGFNLSATRKVSIFREDKDSRSAIFASVIVVKFCFMLISLFILASILVFVPKFRADWLVYLFAFGGVAGNVLSLSWFFQGMERMKYITFLSILARGGFTVAIFVFVKNQADFLFVPLIGSLGCIATGLLGLWIARRHFDTGLKIPPLSIIVEELRDGWHIFISTAAVSLYTTSNTFILGLLTNNTIVGYYTAAEKLIRAVQGLLTPVSQTIYPYISKLASESKERALGFIRKTVKLVGGASFLISLALFVFAKPIVNIVLGDQYQQSLIVLRILAFLPFIIALSNIFGIQTMLTFNMKEEFSKIIISASFLNIILAVLLTPAYKHVGISISVLTTELFVTGAMFVYLKCRNIRILQLPASNRLGK